MATCEPTHIWSNAPVRILTRCGSSDAEIVVATVGPFGGCQSDQHAVVLGNIAKPGGRHRVETGGVLILLGSVDPRPAGIAGTHIEHHRLPEGVSPSTAVISPL